MGRNYMKESKWYCYACQKFFWYSLAEHRRQIANHLQDELPEPAMKCQLCGSSDVERRPEKKEQSLCKHRENAR